MVAEATPPTTSRKKPTGRGHAPNIDLLTRSKARNLYVVRQLPAQEVANQTGLTQRQVWSLATREHWGKTRLQLKEKEKAASLAREEADIGELVEAVAIKSKVLSLGSLDAAIEELDGKGEDYAKNLQMLSVASKNFVGLYRQAKSLDAQSAGEGASQINVMFVGALPRSAERSTVNVTPSNPAIDVQASAASGSSNP